MQFQNLTTEQQQIIRDKLNQLIIQLKNDLFTEIQMKLDNMMLFQVFNWHFIQLGEVCMNQLVEQFIQLYYSSIQQHDISQLVVKTINGKNFIGRILKYKNNEEIGNHIAKNLLHLTLYAQLQGKKQVQTLVDALFLDEFQRNSCRYCSIKYVEKIKITRKINHFIKYFPVRIRQKTIRQLLDKGIFDKKEIDSYYYILTSKDKQQYNRLLQYNLKLRLIDYAILKSYEKWIQQCNSINVKYGCYYFIQYLMSISACKFECEFGVQNEKDVEKLVKGISDVICGSLYNNVNDIKINIYKHLEFSQVNFYFSNAFRLQDIPDEHIISILENIENRLFKISGSKQFIILRKISDNTVFKSIITEENKEEIEQLLELCQNEQLYDVIIHSQYEYSNIQNIKIRYLNYIYSASEEENQNLIITLKHPQDLMNATLEETRINNLSQCTNLQAIYSRYNQYVKQDVQNLSNLKRLYSEKDEYQGEACLLQDLFAMNKLQYVHINSEYAYTNVFSQFSLLENSAKLRYLQVCQGDTDFTFILNISMQCLENLRVYDVVSVNEENYNYGTLEGPNDAIFYVKQHLIHEIITK